MTTDTGFDLWSFGFLMGTSMYAWMAHFGSLDMSLFGASALTVFAFLSGVIVYYKSRGESDD